MADMDPIIREALKRSSQMQGAIPQKHKQHSEFQKNKEKKDTKQVDPPEKETDFSEHFDKTENTLEMLLKNKDRSLIFLLIVLLMNENSDPTLLLALMYLLI